MRALLSEVLNFVHFTLTLAPACGRWPERGARGFKSVDVSNPFPLTLSSSDYIYSNSRSFVSIELQHPGCTTAHSLRAPVKMTSFSSVPNELLLPIFAYLDPNRNDCILGHIYENFLQDSRSGQRLSSATAFIIESRDLRSLALTCKRFRSPATEILLQAQSISGFTISACSSYKTIATRFIACSGP